MDAATASLDALGRLLPKTETDGEAAAGQGVVEIEGEGAAAEKEELERLGMEDRRTEDVGRIRAKALMRRARGRCEVGGWGGLQGAEEGA